ncbi:MAG: hypothetical protein ABJZ55_06430 [Fuerstiella sp.]
MLSLKNVNSNSPMALKRLFSVFVGSLALFISTAVFVVTPSAACAEDGVLVFGDLSDRAISSYGRFYRAASDVEGFLSAIKFNQSAISTVNYFAVSVGGIDAIKDLEEGRGVDPETLAALYAGYALPKVAQHLNLKFERGSRIRIDAPDGRLRYKGTVVRMYSPSKLRQLYALRKSLFDEDDRKRTRAFTEFLAKRLEALGSSDRSGANERVGGLDERYERLRESVSEIEQELRSETDLSTIMPPSLNHLYGFSMGGLNVRTLLNDHSLLDPVTMSAIYASEIETDEAANVLIDERGQLFYKSKRARMLSIADLQECYRRRDILELQSKSR